MKKTPDSRRTFIKNTGMASLGFLGLQTFLGTTLASCLPNKSKSDDRIFKKYGFLVKDKNKILNLPPGFSYKIIARQGTPMSDGFMHPGKPDGMATFVGQNGRVILVRNHELNPGGFGPFGKDDALLAKLDKKHFYDFGEKGTTCVGGTTTLIFNEQTQEIEKSYLSLVGTVRNCAGGQTPWNSWITCEETVVRANSGGYTKNHGYNFEVPATEKIGLVEPIPLKAMGRFNHEAVCVDPKTGIVYQTEDRGDGLFYRFIPDVPGELVKGGKLQCLVVKDQKMLDTRNWRKNTCPINQPMEVEWLDLDKVETPSDTLRMRGHQAGAAQFARGEGAWFGTNELYFACTNGGASKTGQVFRYVPSPFEGTSREKEQGGQLELYLEPNDSNLINYCDNLTIAPNGDLFLCEDRDHPNIVGVTKQGDYFRLAENIGFKSEFAGGVFSPSGKTYFVNIQHAGLTIAIQGPWA